MNILDLQQGSEDWAAARLAHRCASEAAAMMGVDPRVSRTELLQIKKFGDAREISAFTQRLFDKGHEVEALARPRAEVILGEELYPITATTDDGYLLASLDGLTMDGATSWECKQFNQALADSVAADVVPPSHWPQLEHQAIVTGARSVLFTVSDGKEDVSCFYNSVAERRAAVLAGWRQFDADLAAFQPRADAPVVMAATIRSLPVIVARARGELIESNLDVYREQALAWIESINTDLTTDQHFVDAERAVKFCDESEKKLDATVQQIIEQTASVAEALRTIEAVRGAFRTKRLLVDKLVEARKKAIRAEIVGKAQEAVRAHHQTLQTRVAMIFAAPQVDFLTVIKNKRTIASLHDAVDTELARWKIAANELADHIDANKREFEARVDVADRGYFADLAALVLKQRDDFIAAVDRRLAQQRQVAETASQARATEAAAVVPAAAPIAQTVTTTSPMRGLPESVRSWAQQRVHQPAPLFEIIDESLIPASYFVLDIASINLALDDGQDVPGVRSRRAA